MFSHDPMVHRYFVTLLLWCIFSWCSFSQTIPDTAGMLSNVRSISLLARHYGDSVVLRWAPQRPEYWYAHLHQPVLVARREVAPHPGEYEIISDSIRLMSETALEQLAARRPDHPLLIVLLQNAYRDWENSLYDGQVATMLEKADNLNNRWSLILFAADQDPFVAQAAGFRYTDKNIEEGITYAYKVFIPGQMSGVDHKVVHPDIRTFRPMIYQGFQRDSALVLQWQKRMHDAHYSAYHIERSSDGKTFERLTSLPYVQAFSQDPQLQSHFYTYTDRVSDGQTYHYRLIGMDAFGEESVPSAPILLKARDKSPPSTPYLMVKADSLQKGVLVSWSYADAADAHQVMVWYAQGADDPKPVSDVLNASTTSFLHHPEDFNGMSHYSITVSDTIGNICRSENVLLRVPDFAPPSQPSHLVSVTDTTGLIRIRWEPASEKDVIGYFVYAADGTRRHFDRLTPKLYPFYQYTDTVDVHTLTEKRYYFIVAVDDAYNYSPPSDTLEVDRPDVTPPSPAWIQSFTVTDSSVILHLVPSSSRDVARHVIQRRSSEDHEWTTIADWTQWPEDNRYEDHAVDGGQAYIYTVIAYDDQGYASTILTEKHVSTRVNRSLDKLNPEWITEGDSTARIYWQYDPSVIALKIYVKQKTNWTLLDEVDARLGQYTFEPNPAMPVMVKGVLADGSVSPAKILTQY